MIELELSVIPIPNREGGAEPNLVLNLLDRFPELRPSYVGACQEGRTPQIFGLKKLQPQTALS